ncbi:MAG TPA: hypothetical protein VMV71_00065 [Candidatus Paceibacterota bacterium]|nr:hypothetical protein [Candidatus Paceibacterota bacterium]
MRIRFMADGSTEIILDFDERAEAIITAEFLVKLFRNDSDSEYDTAEVEREIKRVKEEGSFHYQ